MVEKFFTRSIVVARALLLKSDLKDRVYKIEIQEQWKRTKLTCSIVTVVLLMATAGFTATQDIIAQRQLAISQRQYATQERPWVSVQPSFVSITNPVDLTYIAPNNSMPVVLHIVYSFQNGGSLPALDVRSHWNARLGPDSSLITKKDLKDLCTSKNSSESTGTLFPDKADHVPSSGDPVAILPEINGRTIDGLDDGHEHGGAMPPRLKLSIMACVSYHGPEGQEFETGSVYDLAIKTDTGFIDLIKPYFKQQDIKWGLVPQTPSVDFMD